MIDLQKRLVAVMKTMGFGFTLNGRDLMPEEVFSDVGIFPAIVRRAEQLSSLCLGYGLGASFEEQEGTLLGVKVGFDAVTPDILRILCITDVMNELAKTAASRTAVVLDELMYD